MRLIALALLAGLGWPRPADGASVPAGGRIPAPGVDTAPARAVPSGAVPAWMWPAPQPSPEAPPAPAEAPPPEAAPPPPADAAAPAPPPAAEAPAGDLFGLGAAADGGPPPEMGKMRFSPSAALTLLDGEGVKPGLQVRGEMYMQMIGPWNFNFGLGLNLNQRQMEPIESQDPANDSACEQVEEDGYTDYQCGDSTMGLDLIVGLASVLIELGEGTLIANIAELHMTVLFAQAGPDNPSDWDSPDPMGMSLGFKAGYLFPMGDDMSVGARTGIHLGLMGVESQYLLLEGVFLF